tara:strand:+ start:306 stop:533 length:228 start_codon:yes stop_codon:yes gene_type:complete
MISASSVALAALALSTANFIGMFALAWGGWHLRRLAAEAIEDARHEFESGFAFLDGRIRSRSKPRRPHPIEPAGD